MVKAAELFECDDDELDSRLADAKKELFNLRFQLATGQLDNVARIGQVRRDVARIQTVMRQREIELAEALERQRVESREQIPDASSSRSARNPDAGEEHHG